MKTILMMILVTLINLSAQDNEPGGRAYNPDVFRTSLDSNTINPIEQSTYLKTF